MPALFRSPHFLLVLSMALWGGTWVAGRVLSQSLQPMSSAFLRFVLASAFLLLLSMRTERRFPRLPVQQLPLLLFLGGTGVFLYSWFFFNGLKTVTAGRAAFIVACIPVCIALISALWYKERFAPARICGTLLSLCGVAVLLSDGDPTMLFQGGIQTGDLFILGCVASWTAYSLGGRQAMRHLPPLSSVTWSSVLGTVLLCPAALAGGLGQDLLRAGPVQWLCIVYLGVLATGLAYFWYYEGIQALGAARAGVYINLVPVFAALFGFLLLGEAVHLSLAAGGAMVVCGVWLTNRPTRSGAQLVAAKTSD